MDHRWGGPPTSNQRGRPDPTVKSTAKDRTSGDTATRAATVKKCQDQIARRKGMK